MGHCPDFNRIVHHLNQDKVRYEVNSSKDVVIIHFLSDIEEQMALMKYGVPL